MVHIISNFEALATNSSRRDALSIIEAGYQAIDTTEVVKRKISFKNDVISVNENNYNLSEYERVFVFGFGKASGKAVQALEEILGDVIDGGIVIDKYASVTKMVNMYQGSHPLPSSHNVEVSQKIADLAQGLTEKDLAIIVVSGGGSALLCWPMSECEQGNDLYSAFLHAGGTISELNTLRKHISSIKGGGLAKLLYPSTVMGLIFCDVPGEYFEDVASGPTYFDSTTNEDAKRLLEKYHLEDVYTFNETPKDSKFFEKVVNIPMVSNKEAVHAMEERALMLGYESISLGNEVYVSPEELLKTMNSVAKRKSVVIAGGELSIAVTHKDGIDGRNVYVASEAISRILDTDIFVSFASDGIDNKSTLAGAVVDKETKRKIKESSIDWVGVHKKNQDSDMFIALSDGIVTGETGSNVSDLYLMLRN